MVPRKIWNSKCNNKINIFNIAITILNVPSRKSNGNWNISMVIFLITPCTPQS